jgi:hypothetical protein
MPEYRFEIADGVRLADPVGLDCDSEQDALAKADMIARQIATDIKLRTARCVVVLDERARKFIRQP